MMMKIKNVIWSVLFTSAFCVAQNPVIKLANLEQTARVQNDLKYSVDGIEGHQYFLDEWGTGKIIINDSIINTQARIQFDMVSGEPIIGNEYKEGKGFILRDKSVTGFVINNTNFVRISSEKFLDKTKQKFFVVPVFTNENYFIIKYSKTLKEPYIANNGYNEADLNKKYVTQKKYYILNKEGKYIEVRLKEKKILKALKTNNKELKKYIKSNNLNLKESSDLITFLNYYHSL